MHQALSLGASQQPYSPKLTEARSNEMRCPESRGYLLLIKNCNHYFYMSPQQNNSCPPIDGAILEFFPLKSFFFFFTSTVDSVGVLPKYHQMLFYPFCAPAPQPASIVVFPTASTHKLFFEGLPLGFWNSPPAGTESQRCLGAHVRASRPHVGHYPDCQVKEIESSDPLLWVGATLSGTYPPVFYRVRITGCCLRCWCLCLAPLNCPASPSFISPQWGDLLSKSLAHKFPSQCWLLENPI